jgi:hypothetical protein
MAYERFANGGLSSLSAGIDDDDLSLTVKSAVGFPTGGNFRIVVDSEIMLVTAVQGKTFSVTRAQEGTSAVSHDADAAVFHVLTAGALAQRDIEQFATGAIGSRDAAGQAGRLYLPTEGFVHQDNGLSWDMMPLSRFTPPDSADFSWVNQGGATVAMSKGMMVLSTPGVASGENIRAFVKTAPATPYEITVAMLALSPTYTTASAMAQYGVCWREGGSGKLLLYGPGMASYPTTFNYTQMTNPTTVSTNVLQASMVASGIVWIRFADDGANRTVKISLDGFNWKPVAAPQGRTVFLTADQVGVFANSWKTSNVLARNISFLHWREA